jgi:hypothetical protein
MRDIKQEPIESNVSAIVLPVDDPRAAAIVQPQKILLLESCDPESEMIVGLFSTLDRAAGWIVAEGWKHPEWSPSGDRRWVSNLNEVAGQFWVVTAWEVDNMDV